MVSVRKEEGIFMIDAEEIITVIDTIRKSKNYFTNYYGGTTELMKMLSDDLVKVYYDNGAVFLLEDKQNYFEIYFYCIDTESLKRADKAIKQYVHRRVPVILHCLGKETEYCQYSELLEETGFILYKRYRRKILIPSDIKGNVGESLVEYAKESDIDIVYHMLYETFDILSDRLPSQKDLGVFIEQKSIIVEKVSGNIVGCIIFEDKKRSSYVRSICIKSNYRNQGIGKKLFNRYISQHLGNTQKFELWVEEGNNYAIRLYEKLGYQDEGLRDHIFINKLSC